MFLLVPEGVGGYHVPRCLAQNVADMGAHRGLGQHQLFRDLAVALTLGDELLQAQRAPTVPVVSEECDVCRVSWTSQMPLLQAQGGWDMIAPRGAPAGLAKTAPQSDWIEQYKAPFLQAK